MQKQIAVTLPARDLERSKAFFGTLTRKPMADPHSSTIALPCLFCDGRAEVDAVASKALSLGATLPEDPEDHGLMDQHGFEDLDGHLWELAYMESMPEQQSEDAAVQI